MGLDINKNSEKEGNDKGKNFQGSNPPENWQWIANIFGHDVYLLVFSVDNVTVKI